MKAKASETIAVRGVEYPVYPFTAIHLQVVAKMLRQDAAGLWQISDLSALSDGAEVIREVILPTLPDGLITVTPRGKYIFQIELLELSILVLEITRVFRERKLKEAEARQDVAAIKDHKRALGEINAFLQGSEGRAALEPIEVLEESVAALEASAE